jgi:nitric oxide dioxygenase
MLQQQKDIVKATVPVLQQYGEKITTAFYASLFAAHPALLNVFNPANQQNGGQARSLAASILTYAAHIDHLEQLGGMVDRIAHKHASLEVQAEHYPIVGEHLLQAITTVLGDAATPEILDAWGAAYGQLATIMIGREQQLYTEGSQQTGGWAGYAPLKVIRKVAESETITSFHLASPTGQSLPPFLPGQYLGVQVQIPGQPFQQIRQYSLSQVSDGSTYRISVKREPAPPRSIEAPAGQISNYLHSSVKEGDTILAHVPQGDFVLKPSTRPVVILSGGVGITPAICMLQALAQQKGTQPVLFVHATTQRSHHAFGYETRALASNHPNIRAIIYYENADQSDILGHHYDLLGRLSLETLQPHLPTQPADYYYCGPIGFMNATEALLDSLNIPNANRYSEAFAPDPSFATELAKA